MKRTVILANGSFPRKGGEAWKLLENAKRVIACDGAANTFVRRFGRSPDFILGDLDSYQGRGGATPSRQMKISRHGVARPLNTSRHGVARPLEVLITDQHTNDLTKAINFCRGKGWKDLVIVGATGKREDHELGNIFRAMEAGVEVVTDYGRFIPAKKKIHLRTYKGAAISVFALDKRTKMTSNGLEWPLIGVKFTNLYCATLNRACAKTVEISSTKPFFIFIAA